MEVVVLADQVEAIGDSKHVSSTGELPNVAVAEKTCVSYLLNCEIG